MMERSREGFVRMTERIFSRDCELVTFLGVEMASHAANAGHEIIDKISGEVVGQTVDFIFRTEDLPRLPKAGDRIIRSDGTVYELLLFDEGDNFGENIYRYCEPFHFMIRVHGKMIAE